ncbi:ABC transporter permease subunit [Vibrio sp. WJH972]
MPKAQFSLDTTHKVRLLKDRLFRMSVSFGGLCVLGALVLIFAYLLWVVIPLFSDASLDYSEPTVSIHEPSVMSLYVDDQGKHAFTVSAQGRLSFWSKDAPSSMPIWHTELGFEPNRSYISPDQNWTLLLGNDNQIAVVKPKFSYGSIENNTFAPQVDYVPIGDDLRKQFQQWQAIETLTFSISETQLTLAVSHDGGQLEVISQPLDGLSSFSAYHFPSAVQPDQLVISGDGSTLYIRSGSELVVVKRNASKYSAREVIDLSFDDSHRVDGMAMLAGGYSLLVSYDDGSVSQWFDVLKQEERHLTKIRDFRLGADISLLLPNRFSKGFFAFHSSGTVHNFYTTSEKLVLFERIASKTPELVALSSNENVLLTYRRLGDQGQLHFIDVNMGHPEISFSSLWQKVWYEGYSEPDYVWQSTSASDSFEGKFSLVPIAFGTLKAAFYSLIFAVPIAVCAAVYTAYFMSPSMRRVVKPTIELMEAFPTVIIGFLAGLWFAPIVEQHLVSVILLLFLLPISTIAAGFLWSILPKSWGHSVGRGWHAIALVPVLCVTAALVFPLSFDIESWLFAGDVRTYLAQHGIDFDQRNALVVGLAMGFAVIPTIFTIAEDAVFSVPKHLSDGSLALGATPWQTLIYVVLLTASPGIFSAIMMGLGRAVGETMIVLMATGNTPIMDFDLFEGMRTLAANIAVELPESEVGSSHYRILFLAALLLFVFTFAVNSLAEWIRLRLREKYRAL